MAKLGLGTVQFGMPYGITNPDGQVEPQEVHRILDWASDHQILVLDTASGYGNSERILGTYISQHQPSVFQVYTKTPAFHGMTSPVEALETLAQTFEKSLESLRQPTLHGLLFHHAPDVLSPLGPYLVEQLALWKALGIVEKIGISVYTPQQLEAILTLWTPDTIQLPLNVFDQRFLKTGLLRELKSQGIEVLVRSCFLQGLLLTPDHCPPWFQGIENTWNGYFQFLNEHHLTPAEGALGFLHQIPEIDTLLVGVCSLGQLQQLHKYCHGPLEYLDFSPFSIEDPAIINPALWPK